MNGRVCDGMMVMKIKIVIKKMSGVGDGMSLGDNIMDWRNEVEEVDDEREEDSKRT